ncbi:MAG: sugar ABC transporter permease, partial [Planctomycetes bacterium]|nr:sugar ABC transporter permease [Planctomycetota bacterium]
MATSLRRQVTGYAFVLPWLIALGLFIGFPFLSGFYFSFCEFPPLKSPQFIGLENYTELLGDRRFQLSLGVTMLFAAVAIPIGVVLALVLAMFLNARIRGQSFYRVIYYIPHLVPTVVVAILWLWIFNPKFGLLNIVLAQMVRAVDAWTWVFMHPAEALGAGGPWVKAAVAGATILFHVWMVVLAVRRRGRSLRRLLVALAIVAVISAAVPLATAGLDRVMPGDMARLRSPSWLSDGNPLPSFMTVFGFDLAPSMALWALIVMSLWGVGQMAVIYLAKLQDVPVELYEAAEIDGANWWHKTFHVTLPMISPVILFNVVMAIIGTFQVFAEPYIMTGGGPEDKTRFV